MQIAADEPPRWLVPCPPLAALRARGNEQPRDDGRANIAAEGGRLGPTTCKRLKPFTSAPMPATAR